MHKLSLVILLSVLGFSLLIPYASPSFSQDVATWTNLGLYGGQIADIAIDPSNPDKMFAATYKGDGLFLTGDAGDSWKPVDMGQDDESQATFKNHSVTKVKIAQSDNRVVWVTHNIWIAKSTDGGQTWTHINLPINNYFMRFCTALAIDPRDARIAYVGTSGENGYNTSGTVFKTGDGGDTWEELNPGSGFDYTIVDIAVDPQNTGRVWAVTNSGGEGGVFGGTLYRSDDSGGDWDSVFSLTPLGGSYYAVAVSPTDSNSVFTASEGEPGSGYTYGIIQHAFDGNTWNQTLPYESDSVLDIAFDPQNPATVYASSVKSIEKSTDGGATWQSFQHDYKFKCIAVHPTMPDIILGGDHYLGVYKGLYGSQSGGYTWTPVNEGLTAVVVYDVAIDPDASTHILAGTISGVYEKKEDQSWTRILTDVTKSVLFDPTDSRKLYAGMQGRLAATVDGGESWNYWSHQDTYNFIESIAVDAAAADTVFIAVASAGYDYGDIYKSTDGGVSFVKVLDGVNRYDQKYGFNVVAIDPSNPQHIFAGGGNALAPVTLGDLWESKNGGTDWSRTGLQFECVNDVLIDPRDSNVLYAGCGPSGGTTAPVYKSIDGGGTWVPAFQGIPDAQRSLLGINGSSGTNIIVVGADGAVFQYDNAALNPLRSTTTEVLWDVWSGSANNVIAVGEKMTILQYDGVEWSAMLDPWSDIDFYGVWGSASTDPATGLANDIFAVGFAKNPNLFGSFIAYYDGNTWLILENSAFDILRGVWGSASADANTGLANDVFAVGTSGAVLHYNGASWLTMASITDEVLFDIWGSASVDAGTGLANDVFAVGSSGTVLHYNGNNWESIENLTTENLFAVWGSASVDAGTGLANDVFAVGDSGTVLHYNGSTWESTGIQSAQTLYAVWGSASVAQDTGLANDVYVTESAGAIFHYDGTAWTTLKSAGTGYNSVTDLAFHRLNPDTVYAGTTLQGVFISPNQAGNWLNLGTPDYTLYAISTGSLYAATHGGLLQCTGTGLITGRISDAVTGNTVDSASVFTDLGLNCISVAGEYMMVIPSGIFTVTAVADAYNNSTENATVLGGDVTRTNFSMESGYPEPLLPSGASDTSSSSVDYCFIAAAASHPRSSVAGSGTFTFPCLATAASIFLLILFTGSQGLKQKLIRRKSPGRAASTDRFILALTLCCSIFFLRADGLNAATLFQNVGIASSPNPVGSGARAMGMGGAFIGVADDATAASWNPAGLIILEKPELSVVADYNSRKEDVSSASHPEANNSGNTDQFDLNYFSATYPFHFHRNIVVSLNYQRLYDFRREFSHRLDFSEAGTDLAQHKNFYQDGSVGALGMAGAIQITPRISLGATLNIWTDQLWWDNGWDESYMERANGTQGGIPVSIDTHITDTYSSFRGINANFGILWDINEKLTVGAVIKTPFTAHMRHTFIFKQIQTYGTPLDTSNVIRQTITEDVELDMPMSYGIGLAWRFSDAFTIDLDVYRTEWRNYILKDDQGNSFSPIDGRPESQSSVEDTTQVRFGGEYLFIMERQAITVPLRAGLFYDPEPSEGSPKSFYGFSIGSGIAYKRYIFDMAYQLRCGKGVDTGNLIAGSEADITQHTILASLIIHF